MRVRESHSEVLTRLVRSLPKVVVQNRLMATSDRDVALALLYVPKEDRRPVLEAISKAKRTRVEEEILLHERLQISWKHYETAVSQLIRALQENSAQKGARSYLRPLRPRPSE